MIKENITINFEGKSETEGTEIVKYISLTGNFTDETSLFNEYCNNSKECFEKSEECSLCLWFQS
jgi:hypothetical protein